MNAIVVTAITNFVFAGEVLFLAGMLAQMPKARFSAAWFWSGAMTLLGVAALIGGVDHGFFDTGSLPQYVIQSVNWLVLGAMTFLLLMSTAMQFFSPRLQRLCLILGIVQFSVNAIAVFLINSFIVVIVNYAPVVLLLVIMNFARQKDGGGSREMIVGMTILSSASAIQIIGVDSFSPLDHNGLYHLVSMVGVAFLYLGGLRLRTSR